MVAEVCKSGLELLVWLIFVIFTCLPCTTLKKNNSEEGEAFVVLVWAVFNLFYFSVKDP